VREVRVLIASSVDGIRLGSSGPFRARWAGGNIVHYGANEQVELLADGRGAFRVGQQFHELREIEIVSLSTDPISVSDLSDGAWSEGLTYPGWLRLTPNDAGLWDVINHVEIETYVPCVVAGEVWPTFDRETLRIQAILARTFVLYQMLRRNTDPYDVRATQGSQVYRGLRDDVLGRAAQETSQSTRGIVCSWDDQGTDRLFCTYYSAVCGGMSQPAAVFGPEGAVKPLSGFIRCDYCRIAPAESFRWGPVGLDRDDVLSRLASRFAEAASLGRIEAVTANKDNATGRLTEIRLEGTGGRFLTLQAERFRLALGGNRMRSTACNLRLAGPDLVIENGRGFGHGLGLCQWGAEGQVRQGKRAGEIIRYYYPGAKLTRVY
jgi:stage II sporulation protein D